MENQQMTWQNMLRVHDLLTLRANWDAQQPVKGTEREIDHVPVVKLFNPVGAATWLLTEVDENGLAFGLADLGFGTPEMGYVDLNEIAEIRMLNGQVRIEQDLHFVGKKPLSAYATEARKLGGIKA